MKKNIVKINESTLRKIVAESVRKVLKESLNTRPIKEFEISVYLPCVSDVEDPHGPMALYGSGIHTVKEYYTVEALCRVFAENQETAEKMALEYNYGRDHELDDAPYINSVELVGEWSEEDMEGLESPIEVSYCED